VSSVFEAADSEGRLRDILRSQTTFGQMVAVSSLREDTQDVY
jgi:hypothetical protein